MTDDIEDWQRDGSLEASVGRTIERIEYPLWTYAVIVFQDGSSLRVTGHAYFEFLPSEQDANAPDAP